MVSHGLEAQSVSNPPKERSFAELHTELNSLCWLCWSWEAWEWLKRRPQLLLRHSITWAVGSGIWWPEVGRTGKVRCFTQAIELRKSDRGSPLSRTEWSTPKLTLISERSLPSFHNVWCGKWGQGRYSGKWKQRTGLVQPPVGTTAAFR